MLHTHSSAPTEFVTVNGVRYAYRRFGAARGTPVVFLQHFRGGLDNWDPTITNGLAKTRPVVLFNNAGVASSGGEPADTVEGMAAHATRFIEALGFESVDILGFSLGGFVAQQLARFRASCDFSWHWPPGRGRYGYIHARGSASRNSAGTHRRDLSLSVLHAE